MDVVFEYVPEDYVGTYPYAVIHLKKSQYNPSIKWEMEQILLGVEATIYDETHNKNNPPDRVGE